MLAPGEGWSYLRADGQWSEPRWVANRWAAFTDDELQILDGWHWRRAPEGDDAYAEHSTMLHRELTAEIERRRTDG